MKKISFLISAMALLFLTNSCDDKLGTEYDFQGKNYASFDRASYSINASSEGKYQVYLYHLAEKETADATFTVSVNYNGAEDLFTVFPTQISFNKDNNKVPIEITYDMTKLEVLKPYTITLSIPNQNSPGGRTFITQDVVITLQPVWTSLGMGVFESGLFGTWRQEILQGLGVESLGIEVYRMPSLYVNGTHFTFIVDATTGDISFPGAVPDENGFMRFETGYRHPDYGLIWGMFDPDPDWSWFDKENKIANFSVEYLDADGSWGWYDEYFDWNDQEPVFDYSADIEFTGRYTNPAGNDFALADVELGADVDYAIVVLVPDDVSEAIEDGDIDAILEGIEDGSLESVQIDADESVSLPCPATGVLTYVVITYADDEIKEVAYATFIFPPININIEDFCGDFMLSGISLFDGPPAEMPVTIEEGDEPNTLVINGIEFAGNVVATFDPVKGTMSIAPQVVDDYVDDDGEYFIEFLTFANGGYSETDIMTFSLNVDGKLVLTPSSIAIGYMIWGENYDDDDDLGWFDGYHSLVFTPSIVKTAISKKSALSLPKIKSKNKSQSFGNVSIVKEEVITKKGSFTIQPKKGINRTVKKFSPRF